MRALVQERGLPYSTGFLLQFGAFREFPGIASYNQSCKGSPTWNPGAPPSTCQAFFVETLLWLSGSVPACACLGPSMVMCDPEPSSSFSKEEYKFLHTALTWRRYHHYP